MLANLESPPADPLSVVVKLVGDGGQGTLGHTGNHRKRNVWEGYAEFGTGKRHGGRWSI